MRYIAIRPSTGSDWDDTREVLTATTVHEPERRPVRTGIINAQGVPIFRVEDPNPIGFDMAPRRHKE